MQVLGKNCTVYQRGESPRTLLMQPVDEHDREELDTEIAWIENHSSEPFLFVAVHVDRWFDELAPWPAPPVFGKTPFGDGAGRTLASLRQIAKELYARLALSHDAPSAVILGGYSLAGLFSLWAGYQSDGFFNAVVAASPSVWYKDWLGYAESHRPQARAFYLSLGDREERSRTPILTTIATAIRRQQQLLDQAGVANTLVWNTGNHFQDNGQRTAMGFVWAMEILLCH